MLTQHSAGSLKSSPMNACVASLDVDADTDQTASIAVLTVNSRAFITSVANKAVQALLMLVGGSRTMYTLGLPLCAQTEPWHAMLPRMMGSCCARACVSSSAADRVKKMQTTA